MYSKYIEYKLTCEYVYAWINYLLATDKLGVHNNPLTK